MHGNTETSTWKIVKADKFLQLELLIYFYSVAHLNFK